MRRRPSVAYGLRCAGGAWRLVVALWLASVVALLPARAVVWFATGGALPAFPDRGGATSEYLLVLMELLRPVVLPLVIAGLSGWLALWAWTVLWHAGVVRWLRYAGHAEMRLAEVLAHGVTGWWRWARLSLTSILVQIGAQAVVWLVVTAGLDRADRTGHAGGVGLWLSVGMVLSLIVVVVGWLATLRGSWLLGTGERRSAVVAWFGGLSGSLRQPVSSLLTLAVWAILGSVVLMAPPLLAWQLEVFRDGVPASILDLIAGVLVAFCWVGLFFSFAPITGLVGESSPSAR